jgi:hypothetical protein
VKGQIVQILKDNGATKWYPVIIPWRKFCK